MHSHSFPHFFLLLPFFGQRFLFRSCSSLAILLFVWWTRFGEHLRGKTCPSRRRHFCSDSPSQRYFFLMDWCWTDGESTAEIGMHSPYRWSFFLSFSWINDQREGWMLFIEISFSVEDWSTGLCKGFDLQACGHILSTQQKSMSVNHCFFIQKSIVSQRMIDSMHLLYNQWIPFIHSIFIWDITFERKRLIEWKECIFIAGPCQIKASC